VTRAFALLPGVLLALAACTSGDSEADQADAKLPDAAAKQLEGDAATLVAPAEGTPLEDRVATLGLLNKRNNLSQEIKLKPGESRQIGNVIVKLASCERTPPWELPRETGAFVQVLVEERASVDARLRWHKVFSGWLFRNSPSLNVVEHPVYDVWVKDCAMNFPDGKPADLAASSTER